MSYNHPIHQANAYEEFASLRAEFATRTPSYGFLLRMCRGARMYGCFAMLMDHDALTFSTSLQASGRCFAHFLPSIPRDEQVVSRAAPFWDAIACGDLDGASLISRNLSDVWNESLEYQEDFLYFRLLIELFFRSGDEQACLGLIDSYEGIIQGNGDDRLDVVRAMLARDIGGFDSGLRAMIRRHKDYYARMRATDALPEAPVLSDGSLFIEGLALIRLAERRGLKIEEDYPLIPRQIRSESSKHIPGDAWRTF